MNVLAGTDVDIKGLQESIEEHMEAEVKISYVSNEIVVFHKGSTEFCGRMTKVTHTLRKSTIRVF